MTVLTGTCVKAEAENGRIWLDATFRLKELVLSLPGHRWNADRGQWSLPLTWPACVQLRAVFRENLEIGPDLGAWAWAEKQRVDRCMILRGVDAGEYLSTGVHADGLDGLLFPLQAAGVEFMEVAGSALNSDPVGAGKTVMTLRAILRLDNPLPLLIVTTKSMLYTWERECARWAPGLRVVVCTGSAVVRKKVFAQMAGGNADVMVVNWELLPKHSRLARYGSIALTDAQRTPGELNTLGFRTVVGDEAHKIRNPKSLVTRAAWAVGDAAVYRFALTGTPIGNVPDDLWSVMRFVSPEEWPSKTAFIDRYVLSEYSPFGFHESVGIRPDRKDEFYACLDARFLRRPRELVVPGLPGALPVQVQELEMGAVQKRLYEQMRKEMLADLEGGQLLAGSPMMQMMRLVQFASAAGELVDPELQAGKMYYRDEVAQGRRWVKCGTCAHEFIVGWTAEEIEKGTYWQCPDTDVEPHACEVVPYRKTLLLREPSNKIDALIERMEEMAPEPAVIFCESRQLLEMAVARLQRTQIPTVAVSGGVTGKDRSDAVTAFQAGDARAICLTYGAGSEGLTLTRANVTIRLQLPWSKIKDIQSKGRTDRVGQERVVEVIDLITRNSVESRISEVLAQKGVRLEEIVRDAATMKEFLKK